MTYKSIVHCLSLLVVLFGLSQNAQALSFECLYKGANFNGKVIAQQPTNGNAATLTVEMNGKTVYQAVPVVHRYQNQVDEFQSPEFNNKNHAPASLFLTVFQKNGKIYGEFSETSYVPVVPSFSSTCQRLPDQNAGCKCLAYYPNSIHCRPYMYVCD